MAVALVAQWEDVAPVLGRASPPATAAAMAAVLAGIFATFRCWRAVLTGLGVRLPTSAAMHVFFIGQLGKYLPGSIWPAVAQIELGRDHQVPERTAGAAVTVFLLLIVATGLAVTTALAPLLDPGAVHAYWWLLAALPLALLVVAPPVLNRLLALALRLARRPPLPSSLSTGPVLRAAGWSLAAWLTYGVHVWVLAAQFGVAGGALLLARATGAFAAAWCAGFLLLLVPAGAGIREAALVLLLGAAMTRPQATAVAVLSRLLFVVGDLGWSAVALPAGRPAGPGTARSRAGASVRRQ
jgi:hypothetical protein